MHAPERRGWASINAERRSGETAAPTALPSAKERKAGRLRTRGDAGRRCSGRGSIPKGAMWSCGKAGVPRRSALYRNNSFGGVTWEATPADAYRDRSVAVSFSRRERPDNGSLVLVPIFGYQDSTRTSARMRRASQARRSHRGGVDLVAAAGDVPIWEAQGLDAWIRTGNRGVAAQWTWRRGRSRSSKEGRACSLEPAIAHHPRQPHALHRYGLRLVNRFSNRSSPRVRDRSARG